MEDADWRDRMDAARIALVAAFTAGDNIAHTQAMIRVRGLLRESGCLTLNGDGRGTHRSGWVARTGSRPPAGRNIA